MSTVEEVKTYLKVKYELEYLCKTWAKNNLKDWQHYSGFKIDENSVTIIYKYQDCWSGDNTHEEFDSIKMPIEDILSK